MKKVMLALVAGLCAVACSGGISSYEDGMDALQRQVPQETGAVDAASQDQHVAGWRALDIFPNCLSSFHYGSTEFSYCLALAAQRVGGQ